MFCPECRTEYVEGINVCADCNVILVSDLQPLPTPEYVGYTKLYSPSSPSELAIIKSILNCTDINFYTINDNFGSLFIGPQIALYNNRIIMVQDDQHERAWELLSDYLHNTEEKQEPFAKKYSTFDKVRMLFEFLLFGWIMPGRRKVDK